MDGPISGQPAFEYRDLLCWIITDPLWLIRNRLNGHHTVIHNFLGGHDVCGFVAHSCFALVPPSKYFDTHPEYYSEINGVRRYVAGQLCLTNPDVVKIATQSLLAYMRSRPDAKLFSVSQQDWEGWCDCPECRRAAQETGSQSGLYVRFVNALAEQTVKEFPLNIITTLAYHYTETPPQIPMTLHPNVRVQLCPIATCQTHPFATCESPQNQRFLDRIKGWSAMTDQLYIWHYATDFSFFSMPLPNLRQLHANIQFYKQQGVRGMFMQANGPSELSELKSYLVARQLWNPDVALETILQEFLPAVFGAAAGEVRAYIDGLQAAADQNRTHHLGCGEPPDHPFYTDAVLHEAATQLGNAEKLVRGATRDNIRLLRGGVDLALLFRRYIAKPFTRTGLVFHNGASARDAQLFQKTITRRREAGNLPLRENTPLAITADHMSLWFERHTLIELKAGSHRIFVAPSLGGRILEWHVGKQQLLEPPDPKNRHFQYPLSEGCSEMLIHLPYSFGGSVERYSVTTQTPNSLTLAADLGNGFHIKRDFLLTPTGMTVTGTVTNHSSTSLVRQWGAGLHLHLNRWTRLSINQTTGPKIIARNPNQPEPASTLILARDTRPTGQWCLDFDTTTLSASFDTNRVTSLILERDDSRNRLNIDLRSDSHTFGPGESWIMIQNFKLGQL
jgi:hypothetical protein